MNLLQQEQAKSRKLRAEVRLLRKTLIDPDAVLAIASELEASFDPGGNLPDDCAEWGERHMDTIGKLRGLAECALMEDIDGD